MNPSDDCPRCGHGLCWHPPTVREELAIEAADVVVVTAGVDLAPGRIEVEIEGWDIPGSKACAGNCQVCDAIETVIDSDAATRDDAVTRHGGRSVIREGEPRGVATPG